MATEKQVNFANRLLDENGYDSEAYGLSTDTPHKDISQLIDALLKGGQIPEPGSLVPEPTRHDIPVCLPTDNDATVFHVEVTSIRSQEVRYIVETMLKAAPKYFYEVPASSTGKYHPDFSLGKGGLVRHVKAAVKIARELLGHPSLYDFSTLEKDCIVGALLLHDLCKSGINDEAKSEYTVHEHPVLVNKLAEITGIKATCTGPEASESLRCVYETIMKGIASHMGPWNTNNRSSIVLPKPETDLENFIHLCDYLASRKFLDIKF